MNNLDATDKAILRTLMGAREQISRPRMGDYVLFATGELERFSHNWADSLQTSPSGSFFLCSTGEGSFSGGLNPCTPRDRLTLTDKMLPGTFWFFHHNVVGAGRGVYFDIPCRVYTTTAEYEGFLGESFRSHKTESLKKLLGSVSAPAMV